MTAKKKRLALHWQIVIGVVLGIVWGIVSVQQHYDQFTSDWIKPFGTVFMNLLKLVAVPLVLVSLIDGIGGLKDVSGLSRMGGRTIGIYVVTTIIAITFGLLLVNLVQPNVRSTTQKPARNPRKAGVRSNHRNQPDGS